MESGVSAERVNGLLIVVKKMRGTMQLAVEVEAGGGMLVASAGAELTTLARAMREAKMVLVCIFNECRCKMCEFKSAPQEFEIEKKLARIYSKENR